jgi:diaminopimelate decarboxylase
MTQTASHIKTTFKLETSEIDLGGGLGVFYTSEDTPPPIEDYIRTLTTSLKQGCEMHHIKQPKLIIEPGRSLIARAGITLYKIGTLKSIPGIREYCFVDGGMADNMRPLLYQAEYTWKLAGKMESPNTHTYTIAGKFCESGDILAKEVPLPEIQPGDLLLSYTTGAYSSSMASNYNRFCRPATVLVENGQATTLVKRETIDDLLRLDETGEES